MGLLLENWLERWARTKGDGLVQRVVDSYKWWWTRTKGGGRVERVVLPPPFL